MSGHSHWATIKRKKGLADLQRGKVFSKMARNITVAARKGGDPEMNPALRLAIEKAKEIAMPKENIERAIKRGTGELKGKELEKFIFEAIGPAGVAIIIEGITDNKNRALNEVKQALRENKGKLVQAGTVSYLFERKGMITVQMRDEQLPMTKEDLELKAIEAGAEDLRWQKEYFKVITKIADLERVKDNLEKEGIKIESASLDWVEKKSLEVSEKTREDCEKLFEALDELDDVQEIYSNLKA